MSTYQFNNNEIKNILKEMDKLPAEERLSFMGNVIQQQSELFKNALSDKLFDEKQNELSSKTTTPCSCGGKYKYKGTLKKKSFSRS